MFGKVSSHIASLHKEVEIIKSDFLNNTGLSANIFTGPTFEEKKNKEILDKLKEKNKPRYEQAQQQQQAPASSASSFSMPGALGSQNPFSANTQTPTAGGGLGGFGFAAPAGGSTSASTAPLSGFSAPAGAGGFTTAGFGGIGAGQTGFGAINFMAPKKAADDSSIGSKGKNKKK
jgi:hypothetical protein